MTAPLVATPDIYGRALDARDVRFDGVFFVGITTTGIYCRPICPARISDQRRRRFFPSAAAAERAGFRPCLRCRPELAPGRGPVDAVSRLAHAAAQRIAAGALNGRSVADLAGELDVSERHLRRVLEHVIGATPVELALTHRLLLAKRLLTDTALPITRIAYASGFQSLRRFNTAFRQRYRMAPSAMRRPRAQRDTTAPDATLHLTLAYRPPLAWEMLLDAMRADQLPGVEVVDRARYARTVSIGNHSGAMAVTHDPARAFIAVELSTSLLPVLMPLLARIRHLFDLDSEPAVIERDLGEAGLEIRVSGLRIPGEMEGFDAVLRVIGGSELPALIETFGAPAEFDVPGLTHFVPTAARIAEAGEPGLRAAGMSGGRAQALAVIARLVATGELRLVPGADPEATGRRLLSIPGVDAATASAIVSRALSWPDAFHAGDPDAIARAERWRPWRAYARRHLDANRLPDSRAATG
ncbi:MAG TPA: AlkA N-terminal domain-containing protein [Gemmatimonadales bacterium]|nr:AlkA N-terminal domain-containing protein [Gemmatimonadales bacterium]